MTVSVSEHRPVIIVGGGLVGGLLALLLAQGGITVTVLDAAPPISERQLGKRDARVLALSRASLHLLEIAGVWQHVFRHAPYQSMQVWHRDSRGELIFGRDPAAPADPDVMRLPELGSMAEPSVLNWAIQKALLTVAAETGRIDFRQQCSLQSMDRLTQGWQVTLATGEILTTDLLVGADGANSRVRQLAGIGLTIWDYHQSALTAAIRLDRPHDGVARQVFLPEGPLAYLPMADLVMPDELPSQDGTNGHWQSLVWSLPTTQAEDFRELEDATLIAHLNRAMGAQAGLVVEITSRGLFPLIARQAERDIQSGLVLVGDASHVVHPMAGQGVNLGTLDAGILADSLLSDWDRELWAHPQALARYTCERRASVSAMMHSLTGLGWLQRSTLAPVEWLRAEGMQLSSMIPGLTDWFALQASGQKTLKETRYAFM